MKINPNDLTNVLKFFYVDFNKNDMENLEIVESTTATGFRRNSFIYDFMSSMRQKMNDPLGQRAKKRKEISQR